jgi:hypothetical protein
MNTIIAGRFEEQARADKAVTALGEAGFPTSQTATFFVIRRGNTIDTARPMILTRQPAPITPAEARCWVPLRAQE